jgi:hypothetical protein
MKLPVYLPNYTPPGGAQIAQSKYDSIQSEHTGDQTRWGEIFRTTPDRPSGSPCPLYNRRRVISHAYSGRSVALNTHPT